jgi:hypothetical protein
MSSRPAVQSQSSSSRFPPFQQTRGSSSLASAGLQPNVPALGETVGGAAGSAKKKTSGPSLSLASGKHSSSESSELHPLKYVWDVWFSQRMAGNKGGKKEEGKVVNGVKEKESREDWEGGVVKLGGFSSVRHFSLSLSIG